MPPDRLAHGYRWEDERWKEEPPLPDGSFGAMGGMLTSIRDLSRYVAAFLDAWPPRDGAETGPISRASLREMQQVWRPPPRGVARDAATAPVRLTSGGYGFGLGVTQNCDFRTIVAHSGGLPGFGSRCVAAGLRRRHHRVRQPHLHRLGPRRSTTRSTRSRRPAACSRAMPQPSPALVAARDAVSRLVVQWDDALADRIAAENLFLDRSKDRRRKEIDDAARRGRRRARAPDTVRHRRERAARPVDDELRARQAAGRDHAGADDARRACS